MLKPVVLVSITSRPDLTSTVFSLPTCSQTAVRKQPGMWLHSMHRQHRSVLELGVSGRTVLHCGKHAWSCAMAYLSELDTIAGELNDVVHMGYSC